VLQDGDFSPLGSEKSLGTDAWVISATNKNLEDEIGEKNFRNDLFYRLNTVNIHLQPLRERPEDVPLLIEHFFNQYRRELNRPEMSADAVLNPEAMDRLLSYHWPGNVRELQNVIKRLVVFGCTEEVLKDLEEPIIENTKQDIQQSAVKNMADDFQTEINTTLIEADIAAKVYEGNVPLKKIGKEAVKKAEKRVILHVLNKTHWNRKKTTEILEISYPALLYKMKDLGIYHVY
jgi:DNA-binding NtrC family response regulator